MMLLLVSFRRLAMVVALLPLGLIGVVVTLLVFNRPLGFVAILGILALIGMIAKNAVILIVQIETDRAEGKNVPDAVMAAATSRLRPMILTAISTVLGLIPIAPTVFWGPMAFAIMGGLLVATLLTLILLPVLYVTVFGKRGRRAAARRGGLINALTGRPTPCRRSANRVPVARRCASCCSAVRCCSRLWLVLMPSASRRSRGGASPLRGDLGELRLAAARGRGACDSSRCWSSCRASSGSRWWRASTSRAARSRRACRSHTGFVDYRTGFPRGHARNKFATITSLMPGTVPVGDGPDTIEFHCLDVGQPVARAAGGGGTPAREGARAGERRMAEFLLAAAGFVLAMVALGLVRVLRGPGDVDRMMAAQLLGSGGIARAAAGRRRDRRRLGDRRVADAGHPRGVRVDRVRQVRAALAGRRRREHERGSWTSSRSSAVGAGAFFFLAGTVGLLRFPDTLTRLHALTKADNLGLGLVVLGLLPQVDGVMGGLKLIAIWLLVLLSSADAGAADRRATARLAPRRRPHAAHREPA